MYFFKTKIVLIQYSKRQVKCGTWRTLVVTRPNSSSQFKSNKTKLNDCKYMETLLLICG